MSEQDIILRLLQEVREDQREHSKELAKQSVSLLKLETTVDKNTEDLKYHIRRTDILEDLHRDNQRKIEINEEIKEEIMGGLLFKLGSLEIDGSLLNRYQEAAAEVKKTARA